MPDIRLKMQSAEDFAKEETLRHPYTRALWSAMPKNGFHYIDGVQPYARDNAAGMSVCTTM